MYAMYHTVSQLTENSRDFARGNLFKDSKFSKNVKRNTHYFPYIQDRSMPWSI